MTIKFEKAYFLLSAADIKQLPPDQGIEIAIAGRSNAGKSSILNCITRSKSLARVSKTPGRTQMLNIFVIDDKRRLMDLPGYGYAKAPLSAKKKWEKLVNSYIETRLSLKGLLLVMDIRHPLRDLDKLLLAYCQHRHLPVHILLNKADKLSKNQMIKVLQQVKAALTIYDNSVTFQQFSALKGMGTRELQNQLESWYTQNG
jgi:GTP-binding protein